MKKLIMHSHSRSFYTLMFFLFIVLQKAGAQNDPGNSSQQLPRINFLVSPKLKKLDGAPISFQVQATRMCKYHPGEMYVIITRSSKDMAKKITRILKRRNAMIGTLWFDSHGHFGRRRSLFEIGDEEFNSHSIHDSALTVYLRQLAPWCDTNTNVGIGSCYGGATYTLPAVENIPAQRMNGDSLMMGLSSLLSNASVYASESFVMTGPGILNACYALSGAPARKKFKDAIYAPVWEKLGEWNCYSGKKGAFEKSMTVSLNQDGSIYVKDQNYLAFEKNRKKLSKKMLAFKRGNYNLSYLYQNN